jgi:DNA ligase (NAD+)
MERVEELKKLIQYYSNKYYNESTSEISDSEFDEIVDEYKSLGGVMEIGITPSYGKKVKHSRIMGSLEKETTVAKITEWKNKYSKDSLVVVTPKIDGLSCRLNYINGKLMEAATRGDGEIGQNVLDNVKMIQSIPKTLSNKLTIEIRGEILMLRSTFNEFLKIGIEDLANPRNAASGSLMAKDPKITGSRNLSFLCYDIITDQRFETELDKFTWIKLNIPEITPVGMTLKDISKFEDIAKYWETERPNLNYDIDGLVIAINSIAEQEEAGWTGHRPKGKMAFKFKPEQKQSKILKIDWQVGRTGRMTPVAYIEPTVIGGSTIQKASLYNASLFILKDIAVNDIALVQKDGDIIPSIVRVITRPSNREVSHIPKECPVCGSATSMDVRNVALWCMNNNCPARFIESVIHYITTLEIMDVGEGIVTKLCESGIVKTLSDLYDISVDQIKKLTGGDRSAEKTYNAIHEKKNIPLNVFLDSLGINGLGTKISKDVAKKFKTLSAVRNIGKGDLLSMEGIQALTEAKIVDGLSNMSYTIDELLKRITVIPIAEKTGSLSGMSFCLTGAMSKPRKEIEKMIEAVGGEAASGVKSGLTYLVQADPTSTSSKTEKALKLGVKILSEVDLWKMIGV